MPIEQQCSMFMIYISHQILHSSDHQNMSHKVHVMKYNDNLVSIYSQFTWYETSDCLNATLTFAGIEERHIQRCSLFSTL